VLTATVHRNVRVLRVAAIGERRGPAIEAQALYVDLTPKSPPVDNSGSATATGTPERASPGADTGRPSKRDRRRISAFRGD
jgi:ribosome-associated heat shock protein Hsp15